MTIRAFFFDLDDTLIDDRAAVQHGAEAICAQHAGELPTGLDAYRHWQTAFDAIYPRFVRGELTFVEQRRARVRQVFAAPQLGDAEADARFAIYLDGYRAGTRLFADVLPTLDRFAHLPLGIITNSQAGLPEGKLRTVGIRERFQVVLDPDNAGTRKPDPAMFHAACRQLGVTPAAALHVGDHAELDARAALAAGLHARWLNRGGAPGAADLPTIAGLHELSATGGAHGSGGGPGR